MRNGEESSNDIPARVVALRKRFGSHDKLAGVLKTTRQVIIDWEKGRHTPGAESARKLAEAAADGSAPEDWTKPRAV
ncbi:MAG: helix-turn-helix transcriptional regulator, partial [Haloechinothrix sp.]